MFRICVLKLVKLLYRFHKLITTYPSIVLVIIATLCTLTTYISLTAKELPTFEDPQLVCKFAENYITQ